MAKIRIVLEIDDNSKCYSENHSPLSYPEKSGSELSNDEAIILHNIADDLRQIEMSYLQRDLSEYSDWFKRMFKMWDKKKIVSIDIIP